MSEFAEALLEVKAQLAAAQGLPAAVQGAPAVQMPDVSTDLPDPGGLFGLLGTDPAANGAGMPGASGQPGVAGFSGTTGRPFDGRPMGNLVTHAGATGVAPAIQQLIAARRKTGDPIFANIDSDYRSRAQQAALYQSYLNGTGNLAAPPGSSNHETGTAFDINSAFLQQNPDTVRYLLNHGFDRDVGGEPWHFHWTGR